MVILAPGEWARRWDIRVPFSRQAVVAGIIGLLWALALWQSWECQGLIADGSVLLLDMALNGVLIPDVADPRAFATLLPQYPALVAMNLGVNDLHWLARIYSLGLFGVPTTLYSLALFRASRDPCVLAATLAAVATVFMSASILISGEHNIAYAWAIFAAVWLTTASGLRVGDGLMMAVVAAVAARLYEHYVYLGPMLALLAVWTIARSKTKPWLATTLYGVAAALFMFAGYLAAASLIAMYASDEQRAYMKFGSSGNRVGRFASATGQGCM